MFKPRVALLSSLLLLLTASAFADGPGPWQKVRDEAGILVHRRTVPGSQIAEFRARGVIEAPLPAVYAVLQDHAHAKDWQYHSVASRVLEKLDAHSEIVYQRSGAPWPVQDRDCVLRSTETLDDAAHQLRLTWKTVDYPKMPPQDGAVRMPNVTGHWNLTVDHDGEWTQVEYQVQADAGGNIPDWLANRGSKNVPFDTLQSLRKQVARKVSAALEREFAARPEIQALLAASVAAKP